VTEYNLFKDAELLAMLRDNPELLAIADALAATDTSAHRRPRARGAAWIGAVAVAAAAALLLVASPWRSAPGLVDKALAAVGDGDVLHLVIERSPSRDQNLVDIASGGPIVRTGTTEIWFDAGRNLKKSVTTLEGRVVADELDTAQGGWTQGGRVITCAWIAAHPAEATKLRVSCKENMENGTTPRTIREDPPQLDEALAGFIDGYRSALASGRAQKIGTDVIDGRPVIWLRVTPAITGGRSIAPASQDVAIDAETSKPMEVRGPGSGSFRVLIAESVPYEATTFQRPSLVEGQGGGNVSPGTPVTLEEAASILGRPPLWLGQAWDGLRLVKVGHHRPLLTFFLGLDKRVEEADMVSLTYETADGGSRLTIYEASRCVFNAGMACGEEEPSDGQMLLRGALASALRRDGLWASIWGDAHGRPAERLELARALRPYNG
jgi:hypothetical protein